ncbi:MAG TPA: TetR/AcrR family transcriptional regulator [Chthoniobacteraceae bacterium]|nr:TetR/AcrR family transcriptional regulator [Chthoniobacteraceae bacterium]
MSRKPEEKGKRQRLIEAANTLFSQKSPMEVTIDDVSREAGLGKGTVYLYFKSRDELMIEMFRDCISKGRGELLSFLEAHREVPPPQLLEQTLDFVIGEVHRHRAMWGIWYQFLALAMSPRYRTDILEIVRCHQLRREQLLVEVINRGKQTGAFRREVNAELTTISFFAVIDGLVTQAFIEAVDDFPATCREALKPLLAAIRA